MERDDLCLLYLPGEVVEWRPGPLDAWQLATVAEVHHQGDAGTGWYTSVVVVLNGQTIRCGLVGPTLKTCIRTLWTLGDGDE